MNKIYRQFLSIIAISLVLGVVSCRDFNSGNNGNVASAKFEVTIENTGMAYPILKSDAFAIPVGASEAAPLKPGEAYEFELTAPMGAHLSLATMFAQSNDWFFSADEEGIALYHEDGSQVTGDVTDQIDLYDAGTEEDQEVGVGDNQAPRQSGPNTGPDDDNPNVRLVDDMGLPSNEEMIRVTLTSSGKYCFKVRIENVSNENTLQTSEGSKPALLSPGVWLVHSANQSGLLYMLGEPDYGDGLEAIAEDGNPSELASSLADRTGLTVPLSPGAFAVYTGDNPIFIPDEEAPENGIEAVAEDGQPSMLATSLESSENVSASGAFNQPVDSSVAGPLLPGAKYQFIFSAEQGDMLSFATMFAESNDLFYAPSASEGGIALFEDGIPLSGDITDELLLWDVGTEANEEPGVGGNQALRQSGPNTGPQDPNSTIRPVDDAYDYGEVGDHIKVSIRTVDS